MRIPGIGGEIMSRLGVNVQVLSAGEVYLALERGAIDAAELVGPYDDLKLGLNKAASYYYYPGWWEPGLTIEVQVNKSQWSKLPVEYQEIFKIAAMSANLDMLSKYEALNREALKILTDGGTELKSYPPEIFQSAQKAAAEYFTEESNKNPAFKKIFDQWSQFRTAIFDWNEINELSYTSFVYK